MVALAQCRMNSRNIRTNRSRSGSQAGVAVRPLGESESMFSTVRKRRRGIQLPGFRTSPFGLELLCLWDLCWSFFSLDSHHTSFCARLALGPVCKLLTPKRFPSTIDGLGRTPRGWDAANSFDVSVCEPAADPHAADGDRSRGSLRRRDILQRLPLQLRKSPIGPRDREFAG